VAGAPQSVKHLLFIAFAFPPRGGAGVQRAAKLVQYLPEFGWRTTVLTVAADGFGTSDDSHRGRVSKTGNIVRVPCFDPVAGAVGAAPAVSPPLAGPAPRVQLKRRVRRLAGRLWSFGERHTLIPDRAILWHPRAYASARRILDGDRIDLICATGEPYSSFLLARRLSRRTGVPFVIDMRDPWTLEPYRDERPTRLRQSIERRQERLVLESAAHCVFATRSTEAYGSTYPALAEKFEYIPNGYDRDDFAGVTPITFDRFTIVHNGTFLPGYRTPDTFLEGLRRLLSARPDLRIRLKVLFVGKPGPERGLARSMGLDDVVELAGYQPHRRSLEFVTGADLLLLVGGRHRWEETGKIYEYLAAGRPVLGVVEPSGAAASLLHRYDLGQVADRTSPAEVAECLAKAVARGRWSAEPRPPAWIGEFDRRRLVGRMAAAFDRVVSNA
jgi:glycosyltransferase involved in cell wall biosynthesis